MRNKLLSLAMALGAGVLIIEGYFVPAGLLILTAYFESEGWLFE